MKKILDIRNLTVSFSSRKGPIPVISDLSFSVFEGEKLGIVGESGSGKSVCLKSILQLFSSNNLPAVQGEILYLGTNLLSHSEKQMQKIRGKEISMIFQDPMASLNPTKKIGEQIIEGFLQHYPEKSKQEAKQYAIEILSLVGIADPEMRFAMYPHNLSGGLRQRVMIAIALSCDPKVILADEPTTALDVTTQAQVVSLLKDLQEKRKTTIILVTHDLSVVSSFCDRVLVMYGGKIVESASLEALFTNPKHPYTKMLLECSSFVSFSHVQKISERTPSKVGCPFWRRCSESMQVCSQKHPSFTEFGENQKSACWLHNMQSMKEPS